MVIQYWNPRKTTKRDYKIRKNKGITICESLKVEKMRIQTEKDFERKRLALEKHRIAIQECQMGIISVVFTPLTIR